jgi:hypothetical protein
MAKQDSRKRGSHFPTSFNLGRDVLDLCIRQCRPLLCCCYSVYWYRTLFYREDIGALLAVGTCPPSDLVEAGARRMGMFSGAAAGAPTERADARAGFLQASYLQ